ncbi:MULTISPECIES: multicopper oxidase domain-containing protein [Aphanothece]|uniref:multicopper oxidase domain-containing protein n=1 Tax=Aphanothece TaxID=1121 RepID=UPI003984F139
MPESFPPLQPRLWRRRGALAALAAGTGGLVLAGVGARRWLAGAQGEPLWSPWGAPLAPPLPAEPLRLGSMQPLRLLRQFDWGQVVHEGGRRVREFTLTADSIDLPLNAVVTTTAWAVNGRVPGPTLRCRAGERLRIRFRNADGTSHSLHFHGSHPAAMDGIRPVRSRRSMVYEFDADPVGVHPYHCHVEPVTRHVSKGLYGLLVVDPPQPRPPADELVLVMGGWDLRNQGRNDYCAFNGIPDVYHHHPIAIYQHQLVRVYLLNMVEWEGPLTFHLHANTFQLQPMGLPGNPLQITDSVTMGVGERHILEFRYRWPGRYMFHPHQDQVAAKGLMGFFDVIPRT